MCSQLKLIFLVISTPILLFGQGGWKKSHKLDNVLFSSGYYAIEAPNGNFIVVGQTYDLNSSSFKLSVLGTNSTGTLLWRKDYGDKNLEYLFNGWSYNGSVIQDGNYFYHVLTARDSALNYFTTLLKFNYQGDTIWQKKYYSNESGVNLYAFSMAKSIDGGIILTGLFVDFNQSQEPLLLLKTDIAGNELWRKKHNKAAPNVNNGLKVVQDNQSKKIIVVGGQYIGNANTWGSYSNIVICDSVGNRLIQKTFNNYEGGSFTDLIQLSDKNFLTCGAWLDSTSWGGQVYYYKSMLVKFDLNGEVIWSKIYNYTWQFNGIRHLHELKNGDLLLQGVADSTTNGYRVIKPQIIRTDKDGNIKWKREIGNAYNDADNTYMFGREVAESFNPTMDGGFILAAQFPSQAGARPYRIIKIDSTACDSIESYCRELEKVGYSVKLNLVGYNCEIFPNPTNGILNIKLDAPVDKLFKVSIADLNGSVISLIEIENNQTQQIQAEYLSAGVYFMKIHYEGKIIETKKLVIVK